MFLQLDSTFFLYGVTQWVLYFIFALTLLFALLRLFTDKRPLLLRKKIRPLLLGATLMLSFLVLEYLVETDGGKKIILSAGSGGDLSSIRLDLRSDNTFRLTNSGPMGGSIYRGRYSLVNDTLKIDNSKLKYLYPTLTFAVKKTEHNKRYFDPINPDTNKFKYPLYFYNPTR